MPQILQPPIAGIRTTLNVPRVRRAVERVCRRLQQVDPAAWGRVSERLWGIYWLTEDFRWDLEEPFDSPDNWVWGRTLEFDLRLIERMDRGAEQAGQQAPKAKRLLRQGPIEGPSWLAPGAAKTYHILTTWGGRFPDDPFACWVLLSPYVVYLRPLYLRLIVAHELGHVATAREDFEAALAECGDPVQARELCARSLVDAVFSWVVDEHVLHRACLTTGFLLETPGWLIHLEPQEFDAAKPLRGKPQDWPRPLRRFVEELTQHNREAIRTLRELVP